MPNDLQKLRGLAEEALTHPLLTRAVSNYSISSSPGGEVSGASAGGSLTRAAQGAIRDLLGWRYRANDPKGFMAALTKAVDLKDVEGHTEFTWKARPVMVQADMGEV